MRKNDFVGRKALLIEKEAGPKWQFVGLEINWSSLEKLFDVAGLPPQVAGRASRVTVPIYSKRGNQIGQATSHTFSPILKQYIAIGTLESKYAVPEVQVDIEITVEYARQKCTATVVDPPFFNPNRKRA